MQRFIVVDLSNFYFDTAKDRLYTGYAHSRFVIDLSYCSNHVLENI
jgi:isoleucyl-tRNA synthetase